MGTVPETTTNSTLESQERPAVGGFSDECSQPESESTDSNCNIKQDVLRHLSMEKTQEENVSNRSSSDTSQRIACNNTDGACMQPQDSQPPCAGGLVDGMKGLREATEEGSVHSDCLTAVGIQQGCDSLSPDKTGGEQQSQNNGMLLSQKDTQRPEQSRENTMGLSQTDSTSEVDKTLDIMAVSKDSPTRLVDDNHLTSETSSPPPDVIPAIVIDKSQQTTSQRLQDSGEPDDSHLGICGWKDHPLPTTSHHHHHHHHPHDATSAGDLLDNMEDDKCYSTEDETSDWETPVEVELDVKPAAGGQRSSKASWSTVKALTRWMPMAHSKLQWTQLAGHKDSFLAGPGGTVFKLLTSSEEEVNLQLLMEDTEIKPYVPKYYATVTKEGKNYIQLQDLLHGFSSQHCVMDIKMGVRTYQEEELTKARKKPTLRKDLYQKMVSIDPKAPTEEEKRDQAILKPRYLKFRDDMSSTSSLGFRIEGTKTGRNSTKDYKDTRTREEVKEAVTAFVENNTKALEKYISTLQDIYKAQKSSKFFASHEIVGSSLLFVHDSSGNAGVWMIDFAKCSRLPSNISITHRSTWVPGNYEDGYWMGLDNIISIFQDLPASRQKKKK